VELAHDHAQRLALVLEVFKPNDSTVKRVTSWLLCQGEYLDLKRGSDRRKKNVT
jgi:hypothetical protein